MYGTFLSGVQSYFLYMFIVIRWPSFETATGVLNIFFTSAACFLCLLGIFLSVYRIKHAVALISESERLTVIVKKHRSTRAEDLVQKRRKKLNIRKSSIGTVGKNKSLFSSKESREKTSVPKAKIATITNEKKTEAELEEKIIQLFDPDFKR